MASPLTDDQLSQLRQDIYDHLDSPSGIQDVEDGVKKLVASARSIDEAFQRGTQGFTEALRAFNTLNVTLQKITHSFTQAFKLRASNLSLRTPNVTLQKIIALRKDWKGYHKRYKALISDSRSVSENTRRIVDDFTRDILSLATSNAPLPDKLKKIESHLEKLDNGAESGAADKLKADFEELRDDVNTFSVEVDGLMKHLKDQEDSIEAKKIELQAAIKSVKSAMNRMWKFIAGGAAVAGSIWAAGGLIALCTGPFCLAIFVPFFMLAVGGAAVAVGGIVYELVKRGQYEMALGELEKEQEKLTGVKQAKVALGGIPSELSVISSQLSVFALIWAYIRTQVEDFGESLQVTQESGQPEGFTEERVTETKRTCEMLSRMLKLYEGTE